MKELLSGNAAIARGAFESGVTVAAAYPGTPSTEILELFSSYPGIYAEWAPNEKVAMEVGIGASIAGARTLVAMKHVGVNVAADPLLTFAYTGVNGGVVLVSADDPGMHSSQNEQDNRYYAKFAKIPLLEPGDSQEAKDMIGIALDISEQFDTPVMLRTTTRVSHSQGFVEIGGPKSIAIRPYVKDAKKYLMVPAFARMRRALLEERLAKLKEYSEKSPLNAIEWRGRAIGIITSGISYQYVRESLPGASVLKLGLTNPLPEKLIRQFAGGVQKLIVVEELEPFVEDQVRSLGITVSGKDLLPDTGELNVQVIAGKFAEAGLLSPSEKAPVKADGLVTAAIPGRPPVLCPGCPHRGLFFALRKLKLIATGDIGCYTLSGLPPLEAMDSCICMGASIGTAHGFGKADPELGGRTVAVIGDSTFLHSGITGLLNMVYNKGAGTVVILDNSTTAMTGHQHHPGTGSTLMGEQAQAVDFEALVRALGVKRVRVIDPLDLGEITKALQEEVAAREPSVIICRRPCILLKRATADDVILVQTEKCRGCKACLRLGCPAISMKGKLAHVDPDACTGCGLCVQVCRDGALVKGGSANA